MEHQTFVAKVNDDFAKVVLAAAEKAGVEPCEQLVMWAQMGAECSRLHKSK